MGTLDKPRLLEELDVHLKKNSDGPEFAVMLGQALTATKHVAANTDSALAAIHERLAVLEAAPFSYHGVHEESRSYARNSVVSRAGGMWIAREATVQRPGDGMSWTLCVKAGRDGKDATR